MFAVYLLSGKTKKPIRINPMITLPMTMLINSGAEK
jgi:hypothetical protein